MLLETFSGDEEDEPKIKSDLDGVEASSEVKDLLSRKLELEKKNRSQELHQQRVMVSAIFFLFLVSKNILYSVSDEIALYQRQFLQNGL